MTITTYGQSEISRAPRLAVIAGHTVIVIGVTWILLGPGYGYLRELVPAISTLASPGRRLLLLACSWVLWLRIQITLWILLRRRFSWTEAVTVLAGLAFYQLAFTLLGVGSSLPLGPRELLGIVLFICGSALNTGAEWQRHLFKKRPMNGGHLYTGSCFHWVRHPNYLGDILWVWGWALLTGRWIALVVVAVCVLGFVTVNIPQLSRYLRLRYGAEYETWAANTPRLLPWLY